MKTKVIVGFIVAFVCAGALLFAHSRNEKSIPAVEVNALFNTADTDKDGVISKAEFEKYLVLMKTVSASGKENASKENVRICPNTGEPCTGDGTGMCSSGNGESCGGGCSSGEGGGCCGSKNMGAKTVQVNSTNETEVVEKKAGGCCSSKIGAEKKEGGCCSSKADTETKVQSGDNGTE